MESASQPPDNEQLASKQPASQPADKHQLASQQPASQTSSQPPDRQQPASQPDAAATGLDTDEAIERPAVEVVVPEGITHARADKVLATHFTDWSRGKLQIAFEANEVLRDGLPILKKTRVRAGECLSIILPELDAPEIEPCAMAIPILFEDDHLVAINKPSGLVVHPGNGITGPTLVHGMLHHTRGQLARAGGKARPGVVHRLDRDTSGVMVFAKTDDAYFRLTRMFAKRDLQKNYLAIVLGSPSLDRGTIQKPIGRHPVNRVKMAIREDGRSAHTDWHVQQRWATRWALLKCRIHTGRTHQIRVHLADLGHPIAGDTTYGYRQPNPCPIAPDRFLLHSSQLAFAHPLSGDAMQLEAPLPTDFSHAMAQLNRDYDEAPS